MNIECPACDKKYNIPDEKLPMGKKFRIPCPACKGYIGLDLRNESDLNGSIQSPQPAKEEFAPPAPASEVLKGKILKSLKNLPPMPQVMIKARKLMADKNSGFQELASILETDQAIATRVLRMANSPYYGLSGKVTSIQHASVVLGHEALGELITVAGSSSLIGNALKGYALESGALWRHSMAVAFGSRIIADKKSPELSNDAFTAGLIHDAGKLILDKHVIEKRDMFEELLGNGHKTFHSAEKFLLGFDHAEMAAEACIKWNIPEMISIPIKHHHYPQQSDGNKLAYILHIADSIAMMSDIETGVDEGLYQMEDNAAEFLDLQPDDLTAVKEEVVEHIEKMQGSME